MICKSSKIINWLLINSQTIMGEIKNQIILLRVSIMLTNSNNSNQQIYNLPMGATMQVHLKIQHKVKFNLLIRLVSQLVLVLIYHLKILLIIIIKESIINHPRLSNQLKKWLKWLVAPTVRLITQLRGEVHKVVELIHIAVMLIVIIKQH